MLIISCSVLLLASLQATAQAQRRHRHCPCSARLLPATTSALRPACVRAPPLARTADWPAAAAYCCCPLLLPIATACYRLRLLPEANAGLLERRDGRGGQGRAGERGHQDAGRQAARGHAEAPALRQTVDAAFRLVENDDLLACTCTQAARQRRRAAGDCGGPPGDGRHGQQVVSCAQCASRQLAGKQCGNLPARMSQGSLCACAAPLGSTWAGDPSDALRWRHPSGTHKAPTSPCMYGRGQVGHSPMRWKLRVSSAVLNARKNCWALSSRRLPACTTQKLVPVWYRFARQRTFEFERSVRAPH